MDLAMAQDVVEKHATAPLEITTARETHASSKDEKQCGETMTF